MAISQTNTTAAVVLAAALTAGAEPPKLPGVPVSDTNSATVKVSPAGPKIPAEVMAMPPSTKPEIFASHMLNQELSADVRAAAAFRLSQNSGEALIVQGDVEKRTPANQPSLETSRKVVQEFFRATGKPDKTIDFALPESERAATAVPYKFDKSGRTKFMIDPEKDPELIGRMKEAKEKYPKEEILFVGKIGDSKDALAARCGVIVTGSAETGQVPSYHLFLMVRAEPHFIDQPIQSFSKSGDRVRLLISPGNEFLCSPGSSAAGSFLGRNVTSLAVTDRQK